MTRRRKSTFTQPPNRDTNPLLPWLHGLAAMGDERWDEAIAAFQRFLEEVCSLSPPAGAPLLAEPLEEGWAAVTVLVRSQAPLPAPLLEEVLALWELHPQELRPPWAGLLIARLLKETGMTGEASLLLSRICEQGPAWLRTARCSSMMPAN